jgi:hypothetical protein
LGDIEKRDCLTLPALEKQAFLTPATRGKGDAGDAGDAFWQKLLVAIILGGLVYKVSVCKHMLGMPNMEK